MTGFTVRSVRASSISDRALGAAARGSDPARPTREVMRERRNQLEAAFVMLMRVFPLAQPARPGVLREMFPPSRVPRATTGAAVRDGAVVMSDDDRPRAAPTTRRGTKGFQLRNS